MIATTAETTTAPIVIRTDHALGACCARETSRYAISDVLIVPHKVRPGQFPSDGMTPAYALATDGRCLSIAETECSGVDGPTKVPGAALAKRKHGVTLTRIGTTDTGSVWTTRAGRTEKTLSVGEMEGTFPPVGQVVPEAKPEHGVAWIGLNPDLLAQLRDALASPGYAGVLIGIRTDAEGWRKPILVKGGNGIGVLMPVHIEGSRDHSNSGRMAEWNDARKTYLDTAGAP